MTVNRDYAHYLDDLRTALAQGMTHWVGGLVKAALIAGCSRQQLMRTAAEVGPYAAREAVQRALDEWSWLETRRKAVTAELNQTAGFSMLL